MYLKKQMLFFAFLCALAACNPGTENTVKTASSIPDSIIVHTGTFEKALKEAREKSRHLVVILSKKDCPPCDILKDYVKKDFAVRRYANDYIFYSLDAEQADASELAQCFYITASPTSLVFSPQGELLTIMSGAREDIFSKVLFGIVSKDTSGIYSGCHTRAAIEGARLVKVLRESYRAQKKPVVTAALLETHAQYPYFYNNYLLSKIYDQQGDATKASLYAGKALKFDSPPELMLYQTLRSEMKAILHADYDASREPYISFDQNNQDLGNVPFQKEKEIVFTLKNTGNKPLLLKDVIVSCSCLSINWPRKKIQPGETSEIKAIYNIGKQGGFHQYAYVISNAINSAVLLTIKGRVN